MFIEWSSKMFIVFVDRKYTKGKRGPNVSKKGVVSFDLIDFWCLTPLSAIFQLYLGDCQFLISFSKPTGPIGTKLGRNGDQMGFCLLSFLSSL